MSIIKAGIIGIGFIGKAHIEAVRRLGFVEVVAIASSSIERAKNNAKELQVPKYYGDWRLLVEDPEIEVVHICTPNHLHFEIAAEVLRTKKALLVEKPLALTSAETTELCRIAEETGSIAGVCFNYRMYPLIQHVRSLLQGDSAGKLLHVTGGYHQDWLSKSTDWNWRLDPALGGASRAIADIGSHWCDIVQYITSQKIVAVNAFIKTFVPTRKVNSESSVVGEDVQINTEDYAMVLFKLEDDSVGSFTVSQVCPGRKNRLFVEIACSEQTFAWDQETPQKLWVGRRDQPNLDLLRDANLLTQSAQEYIHYPPGHEEGWPDAFKNMMSTFYKDVITNSGNIGTYATLQEANNIQILIEAILESHKNQTWTNVVYPEMERVQL